MLVRTFSKLAEIAEISSKYKLPSLPENDPLTENEDVKSAFESVLAAAKPHLKIPERPLLAKSYLNKLAYLYLIFSCKKPEDCDALLTAYWTYCGHKLWPTNGSANIIAQTCVNLDVPEKAADLFLFTKQLRFIPTGKLLNRYIKSLVEKENWQLIIDIFKHIEPRDSIYRNESTYLMVLTACKNLKKWKWAYRFHNQGKEKIEFSNEFYSAVRELASDLSDEEKTKFCYGMPEFNN